MRGRIDLATILGTTIAFGMVIAAIIVGGDVQNFLQLASVLLVIGGTAALTTVCFSLSDMAAAPKIIMRTILYHTDDAKRVSTKLLEYSEKARSKGVLALEEDIVTLPESSLFYRTMRMVVDGVPAKELEAICRNEVAAISRRHEQSAEILRKAGEISPAMGLIGTLIGLVQMLANLEDPSTIGPAMGLALLTTFYGAVLANMVFNPLASKLERNSKEEETLNTIYMIGASSIAKQENPRRLEMMLNTILPPSQRLRYFD